MPDMDAVNMGEWLMAIHHHPETCEELRDVALALVRAETVNAIDNNDFHSDEVHRVIEDLIELGFLESVITLDVECEHCVQGHLSEERMLAFRIPTIESEATHD